MSIPPGRHTDVNGSPAAAAAGTVNATTAMGTTQHTMPAPDAHAMKQGNYGRFAVMLLTSTAVMLVLMYSLVLEWDHVRFSDTRFLMALYMGATMGIVMLLYMLGMYKDARKNALILGTAALVFVAGLYLARSQRLVGDVSFMKAMIPHHSIAILVSERARLTDPRVRKLADEIIASQRREIAEMDALIHELENK